MAQSLKTDSLYDRDVFAWTQDQARKLRARATFDHRGDVDGEQAAEELESSGWSQRNEIRSRLLVVLVHLVKWRYQPERRLRSGRGTLLEQRRLILDEMSESPSLAAVPASILDSQDDTARFKAAGETDLPDELFPLRLPLHDRRESRARVPFRGGDMMRSIAVCIVAAAVPQAAHAAEITLDLPGALDRQSVSYACSDGSAPKVAYYNLPDQSLAVVEIEAGKPRVFVPVLAASGAKYVSGPYVFWTRGSRADISDERKAGEPAVTCRVTR